MNPFATLKSKGASILIIVLLTMLTLSYFSGKHDREELSQTKEKLIEHVALNKRLSDQNVALAEEIRTKPIEFITITKDVDREICNGKLAQDAINNLPRKEVKDGQVSQGVADIDDRLPTDLLRLLK